MLKIKLARFGKKGQPHYRIVVNEAKSKRDGEYVAKLGEYAPTFTPKILKLDLKAYEGWLAKGAQPTETVASLAKRAASKDPFPAKKTRISKKVQAKKLEKPAEKIAEPAKTEVKTEVKPELEVEVKPEAKIVTIETEATKPEVAEKA